MKRLIILFIALALTSCATTNENNEKLIVEYSKGIEQKYPPISLIVNHGYTYNEIGFNSMGLYSRHDQITKYIFDIFKESDLFTDIYYNEVSSPCIIKVNTKFIEKDNKEENYIKRLLSELTLYMIPITLYYELTSDIEIYKNNELIDKYNYTVVVEKTRISFGCVQCYKEDAMKIVLSKLFKEFESNNPFLKSF